MSMKKILVVVAVVFSLVAFANTSAWAAWEWYECTVDKAGNQGGVFEVYLSGTGINGTAGTLTDQHATPHYSFDAGQSREMQATFLSAMAMGTTVEVMLWLPATTAFMWAVYAVEPAP